MRREVFFSENLKYYRQKRGLTQKELANRLGFTEKSVSKWENGGGMPTLDTLLQLSDLFGLPLDALIFEKTDMDYLLGIDGGGTKTVFRLADQNGQTIRSVTKGAANPNDIGMENTFAVLKEGIAEVCAGIPYGKITLYAGISGGGLSGGNVQSLNRFFQKFGFYAYDNGSDVENIVALSEYESCVLVIMGTGFIVYAINGDDRKRIAGWGQFFDDGGCGYTLGRDVISAVLSAHDGSGRQTALTALLESRIGGTAEAHLARFYQGGKRYIASFAGLVFEAADMGDGVAGEILEKNMVFAAEKISTAAKYLQVQTELREIPVLISGGIGTKQEILFPLMKKHITQPTCHLIRLENEPIDGAVKKAQKLLESKKQGENKC